MPAGYKTVGAPISCWTAIRQDEKRLNPPSALAKVAASAGVRYNGDAPWDITVLGKLAYHMILAKGWLGFGEAYMDGLWECAERDTLFHSLLSVDADSGVGGRAKLRMLAGVLRHSLFNLQSGRRVFQIGEQHYDIGNDVFEVMLDPTMTSNISETKVRACPDIPSSISPFPKYARSLPLPPGSRATPSAPVFRIRSAPRTSRGTLRRKAPVLPSSCRSTSCFDGSQRSSLRKDGFFMACVPGNRRNCSQESRISGSRFPSIPISIFPKRWFS